MIETAELEAALDAAWTLDNLEVYGDHLQQLGDPRGELIAVDVHIARHGPSDDVLHRRRRALRAWLELAADVNPLAGVWRDVRFAYGFVEDATTEMLPRLLASKAAPFVRGLTLTGKGTAIEHALAELANVEQRWLTRLAIVPKFRGAPPGRTWRGEPPNIANTELPRLIRHAPRLTHLELIGHRIVKDFAHPALRALRVHGIDALLALFDHPGAPRAAMPAVEELVLGFAREPGERVVLQRPWPALVPAATFPALRSVDLSVNEHQRATTDTQIGVFDVLATLGVLEQIERLRLPSIRNAHEAATVQRVLDRMPALRRLEVMRGWGKHGVRHPHAEVVELAVPWPLRVVEVDSGLTLWFEGDAEPHFVRAIDAVPLCERAALDDDARAAWAVFWRAYGELRDPRAPAQPIAATDLVRALDALGHLDTLDFHGWRRLRMRARLTGGHGEVRIARRRDRLRG